MKLKIILIVVIALIILSSGCTDSAQYKKGYDKGYSSYGTSAGLYYSDAKFIADGKISANSDECDYAKGFVDGFEKRTVEERRNIFK
jgi:hypothetical protein